jgi:hypothetical protein
MSDMTEEEQFFYEHAGWGYFQGKETPEEGRLSGARELARAEKASKDRGWWVEWRQDDMPFDDDVHDPNEYGYIAVLFCTVPFSGGREPLDSLGAIDAEDGDPYRRVVAAQLALEALTASSE